jgi:hypothetical protein
MFMPLPARAIVVRLAMDLPNEALARWLAHGVSSRTHPVLHWAMGRYFCPLGIRAESLEAEPFSALESGLGEWWLRGPCWNPVGIDPEGPAGPDLDVLRRYPGSFAVEVDRRGLLSITQVPSAGVAPAVSAFWADGDSVWRAARHAVRAAHKVESVLFGAAGMILAGDPLSEVYAGGDDAGFCEAVARAMNI